MHFKGKVLVILLLCALTGCGKSEQKVSDIEIQKGDYVEKEITMPDNVVKKKAYAIQMRLNPNKKIEVLIHEKKGATRIEELQEDGAWKEQHSDLVKQEKDGISDYCYDPCGNLYTYKNIDEKVSFNKHLVDGTKEKIAITDYKDSVMRMDLPKDMRASADKIVIETYNDITAYQDGNALYTLDDLESGFSINSKELMASNEDYGKSIRYALDTGEKIAEVDCDAKDEERNYCTGSDGIFYMIDKRGIYRLDVDQNQWIKIIDGGHCSFGYQSCWISNLEVTESKDFYVMCEEGEGVRRIYHYYYDETVEVKPKTKLTILGLYDSKTIRQAIQLFQIQNNSISVDYVVLQDENREKSELIHELNTKILAKDSYDLLVLDGLPIESYIDKGILEDIHPAIENLSGDALLQENIVNAYEKNGEVYALPARIGLPLCFGEKDAVEQMKSFKQWNQYVMSQKEDYLFGKYYSSYFVQKFQSYFIDDFIDRETKTVDDSIVDYITNLKEVYKKSDFKNGVCEEEEEDPDGYNALIWMMEQEGRVGFIDATSMCNCYIPMWIVANQDGCSVGTIHNKFVPKSIVGISSNSEHKQEAEQFLEYLFSYEIQKKSFEDGFPMNQKALANYELEEDDYCICTDYGDITQPSVDDMKRILEFCRNVNSPVNTDEALTQLMSDKMVDFLENDREVNNLVNNYKNDVTRYLQE